MGHSETTRNPAVAGVHLAASRVAAILPPTPLIRFDINGVPVWAKAECLQPVGAFKIRGAWHRLCDLSPEERARGVVAVSSGNHAQGVAWAAKRLGMRAWIVMPADAPPVKLARTRELGAEVVTYDRLTENREEIGRALAARHCATLVHAFADPWVIEGQGSAGIEADAQMQAQEGAPITRIVCPCGGGGLASGLALALPDAEVIPVEPLGWDAVGRSLAAGALTGVAENPPKTICDALQPFVTSPLTLGVLAPRGVQALTVTDDEVRTAQRFAFDRLRLVVEPGGAAALAAVLAGKSRVDGRTVVVLSGGNVDPAQFAKILG